MIRPDSDDTELFEVREETMKTTQDRAAAVSAARRGLCALALTIAAAIPAAATTTETDPPAPRPTPGPAAARLPVEAFARRPLVSHAALSPDGKRIAAVMHRENDSFVAVRELGADGKLKPVYKGGATAHIGWVHWVSDKRLVVQLSFPARRHGVDTTETRLVSLRADGGDVQSLPRLPRDEEPPQIQDRIVDWLPDDGRHILVELTGLPEDVGAAIYRIDVETGDRERVSGSHASGGQWLTDQAHRPRVVIAGKGTEEHVLACDPDGTNWRTLWSFKFLSRDAVTPLGFGKDPNRLFVLADHEGLNAVYEVDLSTPELKRTLKLSDAGSDLEGSLIISPRTHEAVGVSWGVEGQGEAAYWNEDYKAFADRIDHALPGRFNHLVQLTAGEAHYLVYSDGNGSAPEYYIGDTTTHSLDLFADLYPQLPEATLARKIPLALKSRDGLELPSVLTLPVGSSGRNLPAVILPHGGPIASDSLAFDPWSQFLANRGIAVLQVNFRGSGGYGHDFMAAGLKRWGLEMQDDLTDATRWLVDSGVADPRRICIVGGSYGGYAALMGAVKTPELYRCAASFAGVTDLFEFTLHEEDYTNAAVFHEQVASREGDMLQMRATSPRYLADRIRVPVLLVHGTLDRSVPYEQSVLMADALKAANKDVRFVTQKDGDHHLSSYAQSLEFFRELDTFLAANLGLAGAAASR
jgi:dipeptidyl aminopeptidase/acylaminoacyl peptidase